MAWAAFRDALRTMPGQDNARNIVRHISLYQRRNYFLTRKLGRRGRPRLFSRWSSLSSAGRLIASGQPSSAGW
jgi:hypothetical protein